MPDHTLRPGKCGGPWLKWDKNRAARGGVGAQPEVRRAIQSPMYPPVESRGVAPKRKVKESAPAQCFRSCLRPLLSAPSATGREAEVPFLSPALGACAPSRKPYPRALPDALRQEERAGRAWSSSFNADHVGPRLVR